MRVVYSEKEGRIWVGYEIGHDLEDFSEYSELERACLSCDFSWSRGSIGFVSDDIQRQGVEAIEKCAREAVEKDLAGRLAQARIILHQVKERMQSTRFPLRAVHEGVTLKGCAKYNGQGAIVIRLEEPFALERGWIIDYPRCLASAVAGHRVFNKDGTVTDMARRDAEKYLVKLYEEEVRRRKYGDVLDMVASLNAKSRQRP